MPGFVSFGVVLTILHVLLTHIPAAGPATAQQALYERLSPLTRVVDIQGVWKALKLPALPPTFCHVGLLGWHCHNTTMHPWDPHSLIPKEQMPSMPANASCVICPLGWKGPQRHLIDVLLDMPFVQAGGQKLPPGFYDMALLKQEEEYRKAMHGLQQQGA